MFHSSLKRSVPRGEQFPQGLFLVVSAEMLALLPFAVILRDYSLVALGPSTDLLGHHAVTSDGPARLRPTHQEEDAAAAVISAACATTTWLLCPRTDTSEVAVPNP